LLPDEARGAAAIVFRERGVAAGLNAARIVLDEMGASADFVQHAADGTAVESGTPVADLNGPVRGLLPAERIMLNLIGRLSGIATLTRRYVDAVAGTGARIYDTRKTTPGWRRLEKYAIQCGGGRNHRTGLFDAILIKDNHLAGCAGVGSSVSSPAEAVRQARRFLAEVRGDAAAAEMIVEIEVDSLDQLENVLPGRPDIVLLDNMDATQLRQAVAMRDAAAPGRDVQLEASGGIDLTTVRGIAESGVDRISVGALTHSAVSLDVGMDWLG